MKKILSLILTAALAVLALGGCGVARDLTGQVTSELQSQLDDVRSEIQSGLDDARSEIQSGIDDARSELQSELDFSDKSSQAPTTAPPRSATYTMADIQKLKNTSNFAKNTLEHIFDGTINGKGKATGYHYDGVTDSKGKIIEGTESAPDEHGVYTAKVEVDGVKKNGFSSFYPADWSPQQVVDAINEAYDDALGDKSNPHGELWIGYAGDLEINMYLNNQKKITTAYPIYEED